MSLGISVNKERNGALLAYIAKNVPCINLRKLLKIVYLIDERFMELRGFPLTWFDYYAWKKGPVAPEVYDIKNGAFSGYVTCMENSEGKHIVESVTPSKYQVLKQMEDFSQYEIDIIDDVLATYASMSADDLTDKTHEDNSLWTKVVAEHHISFEDNSKSDIIIPLTMLNEGSVEKMEVYEDARWNMEFQALLNN